MRTLIVILIFLSAMPDTMAAPVVKELIMDRYRADSLLAQMFNGINLLGAIAALPLLWFARSSNRSISWVIWASIADALLLGSMALPLGPGWTMVARALEGVTDVIVFAALFDLVRRASRTHVAHMREGDFYHGEKSMTVEGDRDVRMEGKHEEAEIVSRLRSSPHDRCSCSKAAVTHTCARCPSAPRIARMPA